MKGEDIKAWESKVNIEAGLVEWMSIVCRYEDRRNGDEPREQYNGMTLLTALTGSADGPLEVAKSKNSQAIITRQCMGNHWPIEIFKKHFPQETHRFDRVDRVSRVDIWYLTIINGVINHLSKMVPGCTNCKSLN